MRILLAKKYAESFKRNTVGHTDLNHFTALSKKSYFQLHCSCKINKNIILVKFQIDYNTIFNNDPLILMKNR